MVKRMRIVLRYDNKKYLDTSFVRESRGHCTDSLKVFIEAESSTQGSVILELGIHICWPRKASKVLRWNGMLSRELVSGTMGNEQNI